MVDRRCRLSHVLDENDLTQAQEKCLDLKIQATNIFYRSLHDNIFGEIMDMKIAHEIWTYLNGKYGMVSNDDDGSSSSVAGRWSSAVPNRYGEEDDRGVSL